jgi:hypothetical protein
VHVPILIFLVGGSVARHPASARLLGLKNSMIFFNSTQLNMAFTIPRGIQASGALLYSFPHGSRTLVSARSCPLARVHTLVRARSFPYARSRTLVPARSFSSLVPARRDGAAAPPLPHRASLSSPLFGLEPAQVASEPTRAAGPSAHPGVGRPCEQRP